MIMDKDIIKRLAWGEYFGPMITNAHHYRLTIDLIEFDAIEGIHRGSDVAFPESWFIVLRSKNSHEKSPCSNSQQKSCGWIVLSKAGWQANRDMLKKECEKDRLRCKIAGHPKKFGFEIMEMEMENIWRIVQSKKIRLIERLEKQIKFVEDNYD